MAELIKKTEKQFADHESFYLASPKANYYDSLLKTASENLKDRYNLKKGEALLYAGKTKEAIAIFKALSEKSEQGKLRYTLDSEEEKSIARFLSIAYMRLGEQENCIHHHDASASCIVPIAPDGYHHMQEGSRNAIALFEKFLNENSHDLTSRWLLNVAYMTLGEYPEGVPEQWLIPETVFESKFPLKKFEDMAPKLGLNVDELSGGSIVDDFNNDNLLDVMVSSWFPSHHLRYFVNNGDGTFTEKSDTAGIMETGGGLNMVQADYDNDGFLDVFILRGAWMGNMGKHPNSLLRNNGDNTFTDVTIEAGLLSLYPTQTAVWQDFNNDGWLDLFIGNESQADNISPCELFINNHDGTFTNQTEAAGVTINSSEKFFYVKAVTSADYNNDGWMDVYVSNLLRDSENLLFLNNGLDKDGKLSFREVSASVGLDEKISSFPAWSFDYDNDGWIDIFVAGYERGGPFPIATDITHEFLGEPYYAQTMRLYKNEGGSFRDVSKEVGLNRIGYAMGSNYGDLDNDGFLDIFLGTGEVSFESIIPNKVFRNNQGETFQDVTTAGGFGNIQKGHGVSFSDIDNDGDQDIYIVMGGAFEGDVYFNSLFKNPYQNENNWLSIRLEGITSNRSAIGSKIEVTTMENGEKRTFYHTISSGGSFGCSTLRAEIGLGKSTEIVQVKVVWAGSLTEQVFNNIELNTFYKLVESRQPEKLNLNPLNL